MKNKAKESLEAIKKQLEEKAKEAENYLDNLKRLKAEFENFQKRIEKENIEKKKYASEELIAKLLNLKDDFERALKHAKNDDFSKGVKMILELFDKILEEEGVKALESLNKEFNAEIHEAIAFIEGKENIVLEELQKGYKLFDKIIRPAKVKIGQGGKENE